MLCDTQARRRKFFSVLTADSGLANRADHTF